MRIYELSKELNVSSKDLLQALNVAGIAAKNHMSSIDEKSENFLRKKFSNPAAHEETKQKPHLTNKEPMQKESAEQGRGKFSAPKKIQDSTPVVVKKETILTPVSTATNEDAPKKIILKPMLVGDVADYLLKPVNEVILTLLRWGVVAPKNKQLPEDIIARLAAHYGVEIEKKEATQKQALVPLEKQGAGSLKERLPVIVVLGHVDHGKTSLLDFIRKTRVVSKEKGGITQHLGAYQAHTNHGDLVFLDTPGHEAFPKIRQRGVRVADIGVLVIAADDGIMPQTIEAIQQLKTMKVPIVVAINKIDKVEPVRLEVVKRQLAEQDLLPEEWGGEIVCIPISALTGKGVDQLLEMIALQAQLLELRASREGFARCYVLESKLEKGRGPVATLICQHGTLRVGDYFVCGSTSGRVSSIKNSQGKMLQLAEPSIPVLVAGFKDIPAAGDLFNVLPKADIRSTIQHKDGFAAFAMNRSEDGINLLIKTDTNSSREALLDAIHKLTKKSDASFNIVHSGVGDISESDVELAYSTGTVIIGLHVKAESNALLLAQRRSVSIRLYDIIYKLLESLAEESQKTKKVEMVKSKIGEAIVRAVFDIKGVGVVAGSYVQDGRFVRDGYIIARRGSEKIGEGRIISLQRDKKTVKEVHTGYECGFVVEGITDWQVDDRAECYIEVPKK